MSVAKPFVLALVGDAIGPERVRMRVGGSSSTRGSSHRHGRPTTATGALANRSMLLSRELGLDVFATRPN